jgi:hypothetical protein
MVSDSEAILVEEVSLAGSGVAEEDGVSEPRLIEQPETASAISATEQGARNRQHDAPDQDWTAGMAIDAKYSRDLAHDPEKCSGSPKGSWQTMRLLVACHAAKYSRQKQKRGPEARVG